MTEQKNDQQSFEPPYLYPEYRATELRAPRHHLVTLPDEWFHRAPGPAFGRIPVRPGDADILDCKISVLKANSTLRIQIAGNCDERGSDEYNLALGNRRALSSKAYLVNHGIDASRIETLSYGKERPLDPGHNQGAWAKNRNDQFELLTTNVVLRQP